MICTTLIFLLTHGPTTAFPTTAWLDAKVRGREVSAIKPYLTRLPAGQRDPLAVIKTNGAYAVGIKGWSAKDLISPSGTKYVVFATPLTSEDTGELLFQRIGNQLLFVPELDAMGVKPIRHKFNLEFDLGHKKANLTDELILSSNGKGDFVFRMSPQYRVRSVQLVGSSNHRRPLKFSQGSGIVAVTRPKEHRFTIKVTYDGVVNLPQYAGSISSKEASLVNDYWYPMIARWPSPFELTVTTPSNWTAVGQGERLGERRTGAKKLTRFRMDLPCVFYSVSAAPYRYVVRREAGREFRVWSLRMTKPEMEIQTHLYPPIIKFYEQFAKFPFSGYGALDSEQYGGGALEAYSFATYGGGLPDEDAHEPSHTWFGGMLNNTYLDSFWNESFAVFADGLYHRNVTIGNTVERRQAYVSDASGTPSYNRASCAASGADIGPISSDLGYGKGAKVLQMLEQLIGTPKIISAIHRWIVENPAGAPASWAGFERAVIKECPKANIKEFFDDWIRRPGYAKFSATNISVKPGTLQFDIRFEGPKFRVPLEGYVGYEDGSRQWFARDVGSKSSLETSIPLESGKKPVLLCLDPWLRILRQIDRNEQPTSIRSVLGAMKRYTDPEHKDYLSVLLPSANKELPTDFNGAFLVGSPETQPALKPLFDKVGFVVVGNTLSFDGTKVDLNHGGALALVDLGDGKRCVIGIGKIQHRPTAGNSRLIVFDDYGRFLRGRTEPKSSGSLTYVVK